MKRYDIALIPVKLPIAFARLSRKPLSAQLDDDHEPSSPVASDEEEVRFISESGYPARYEEKAGTQTSSAPWSRPDQKTISSESLQHVPGSSSQEGVVTRRGRQPIKRNALPNDVRIKKRR